MLFKRNSLRRIGEVVKNPRQIGQGFKRSLNKIASRAPQFLESVDKGFKKVGDVAREASNIYEGAYERMPKSKLGDNVSNVLGRVSKLS